MKSIILFLSITIFSLSLLAQKQDGKIIKTQLSVAGTCGMCKDRIEAALENVEGVKKAQWSIKTHQLTLVYNSDKISLEKIKQTIADAGHDLSDLKASDEAYKKLPDCCDYRNGATCTH